MMMANSVESFCISFIYNLTAFRLIGGKTESEGRIEVFNKAEWGAVCATDWDKKGATAVCRSFGYA